MDKLEAALIATEDNAEAIRALNRALKQRPTINCIWGVQTPNGVSFGDVHSDGHTFVLLMIPYSSQKREIRFCGQTLLSVPTPSMFPLPKGKGELVVRVALSLTAALVFNAVE